MKKTTLLTVTASAADFLATVSKFPLAKQDIWLTSALKTVGYYRRVMWKAILKYYNQELGDTEFLDVMIRLIEGQLRRAWNEGMRSIGLDPATDMKPEWELEIQEAINSEFNYVLKLGTDIQTARERGLSVDKFRFRVELWVNRYTDMVNRAMVKCGKDLNKKLKWKFGDRIHCPVCLALNGIVTTALVWWDLDVRPQSPPNWALGLREEGCAGWHCGCSYEVTTDRVTVRADLKIFQAVWGRGAVKGGEGSGHFGHAGRPGELGGSLPSGIIGRRKFMLTLNSSQNDINAAREEWTKQLTDAEKQAIHVWGVSGYGIRKLESGEVDLLDEVQRQIAEKNINAWNSALDKGISYKGVVARGLTNVPDSIIDEWEVGEIITLENDQSATSRLDIAKGFGTGSSDTNNVIWILDQENGIDLLGETKVTMGGHSISEFEVVLRKSIAYEIIENNYIIGKSGLAFNQENFPDYFEGSEYSWSNMPDSFRPTDTGWIGYYEMKLRELP